MRFAAKDYFTAGNLLAGLATCVLAIKGNLFGALSCLFVAMAFDLLDGIIARLTGTQNAFGGSFDNVCDHMSYGITPSFFLFATYDPVFQQIFAENSLLAVASTFSVASVPLVTSSLRFARSNTFDYEISGVWLGLPRPASAFAIGALVNSHFFELGPEFKIGSIAIVVLFGYLNISTFPYPSHHHRGGTPLSIWAFYITFLLLSLGTVVFSVVLEMAPRAIVGDIILASMLSYSLLGGAIVSSETRQAARAAVEAAEKDPS